MLRKNLIDQYPHLLAEKALEMGYISKDEISALAESCETEEDSRDAIANYIIEKMANGRDVPVHDRLALVCVLMNFKKEKLSEDYLKVRAMIRHKFTPYEQMLKWLTPSGFRGPYVESQSPWIYRRIRDEYNIAAEAILSSLGIHGEPQTQLIALPVLSASIRMDQSYLIATLPDGERAWIHVSRIARFQRMRLYEYFGRDGDLGLRIVWLVDTEDIERKPHILAQVIRVSHDDKETRARLDALAHCN